MSRKKEVIRELEKIGRKAYKHINNGEYPKYKYPTKRKSNIKYNPETGNYKFKDKTSTLTASNVSQVSFLARLYKVANIAKELVQEDRQMSKRELLYVAMGWDPPLKIGKKKHGEKYTNRIIQRIEQITGLPREEFGFYAEEKGKMYGDITIKEGKKKRNPLDVGTPLMFPTSLTNVKIEEVNADHFILLEAKAAMKRLSDKIPDEMNYIVASAGGYSPRMVIQFMRRIDEKFSDVSLWHIVDLDAHGLTIHSSSSKYSVSSSHVKNNNVPGLKYLGISGRDAKKYFGENSEVYDEEKESNIKKCKRRLKNFEKGKDLRWHEEELRNSLKWIVDKGKTLEVQAFAKHSLDAFAEYVNEKLEKKS